MLPRFRGGRSRCAAVLICAAGVTTVVSAPAGAVTPHPEQPLDKDNLQALSVKSIKATPDGATFALSGGYVGLVRVLAPDVVKVSVQRKGEDEYFSPAIAKRDWAKARFTRSSTRRHYILRTSEVNFEVQRAPFGVRVLDRHNRVIHQDDGRFGAPVGYEDGKPFAVKKTEPGEAFYGFGEQTRGLNHRGDSLRMWNTDQYGYSTTEKYIYSSIPFFMGKKPNGHAYGIYFDNTHRSYYEMATESEDYYYFYADGGELSYYFFNGPDIPSIVGRYTELTGRYPQPPDWALGWQQSAWGNTGERIVEVAKGYRDRGIPLDTVNFDIDYMNEYRIFTWNERDFNPESRDAALEAMDVSTVAINDPAVKRERGYHVFDSGEEIDAWVRDRNQRDFIGSVWPGPTMFPDFMLERVRDWWADLHGALLDRGVEGIWLDMNEPANFMDDPPFHHTLPVHAEHADGRMSHAEAHNLYGLMESEATRDAFDTFQPNTRPFILTRAAFAGNQRTAALWTGDNVSRWSHLAMSLPMHMNVGLSGIPHVGSDIGGFGERATPELMARWLEAGAFYPHARVHYGRVGQEGYDQEPWSFGPEVEGIAKRYVSLRYQLMPYTINAFREASRTGAPVQRPLVWEFQDDPKVRDIADQFMWGDDIMVAPVVQEGQRSRDVYLPAGSRWTDFWTGQTHEGGQTITRDAPLDVLPIYVQSNSIVANREPAQSTKDPMETLYLDAWVASRATTTFYEDDGETLDHTRGEYDETRYTATRRANGTIVVDQSVLHDGFASSVGTVTWRLHDVARPTAVVGGGARTKVSYDRRTRTAKITVSIKRSRPMKVKF